MAGIKSAFTGSDQELYADAFVEIDSVVLRPKTKYAFIVYHVFSSDEKSVVAGTTPVAGGIVTAEITDPETYDNYFKETSIDQVFRKSFQVFRTEHLSMAPGGPQFGLIPSGISVARRTESEIEFGMTMGPSISYNITTTSEITFGMGMDPIVE